MTRSYSPFLTDLTLVGWEGVQFYPQAGFLAVVSEPLGVEWNALVTFRTDGWATKSCNPINSTAIQESNMAAAKPEMIKFLQIHHTG